MLVMRNPFRYTDARFNKILIIIPNSTRARESNAGAGPDSDGVCNPLMRMGYTETYLHAVHMCTHTPIRRSPRIYAANVARRERASSVRVRAHE